MSDRPDIAAPIEEAAHFLAARGVAGPFACAIVLGSGLGAVADQLEDALAFPYATIPHCPRPGVSGHEGRLLAGTLQGRRVLLLQGRVHAYEHGDAAAMRVPIGLAAALGAPAIVLTNAAGSTHGACGPGGFGLITDHINLSGMNPLIGEASDGRFLPMTAAYDPELRARLQRAAAACGVPLTEGTYLWFSGPSFETSAEIRMARLLGADFVGMSTVPEVILARFYGLRVAALSLVTNWAAGFSGGDPSHAETKSVAAEAAADLSRLLGAFLAEAGDV